ncbi:dihydropteroate synthase [Rhodococcus opacus]|uniref:dihydropteroate synthase n=1 Tax=Rhodococcus opacus TaxID=37919 RepID=UPI00155B2865|nr:dihydropteroate synthase [Rhodococcus opacus]
MTVGIKNAGTMPRLTVLGVLNVTPDSFSDGGRYSHRELAVDHGLRLRAEGADIVDVGGESTRPGAHRVDAAEELRRVLPVIRDLTAAGVPTSIDTTRADVAEAALNAGAILINDVSGGLCDTRMTAVAARADVPWVLTHSRGLRDRSLAFYRSAPDEVCHELMARIDTAILAGIGPERLVLDPGLGFDKRPEHDLALLADLRRITDIGLPVLVGASRKSFLGEVLASPDGVPRPVDAREAATLAVSVVAATAGAWGVRVHDVASTVDALRLVAALPRGVETGAASAPLMPADASAPQYAVGLIEGAGRLRFRERRASTTYTAGLSPPRESKETP